MMDSTPMTPRITALLLGLMWLLTGTLSFAEPVPATAAAISADEVLQILKAKDRTFDNAQLNYTVSGTRIFYPMVDRRKLHETKSAKSSSKPETLWVIYHEQMTVRGSETTFSRQLDETVKPTPSGISVDSYQKMSNAKGLARNLSKIWHAGKGNFLLEVSAGGRPGAPINDYRAKIEYSLGMGFGKRIKSIDSVKANAGGFTVSGAITLWWTDKSTFEIELDKDFIVRRAKMQTDLPSLIAIYEVSTSGNAGEGNFICAKKGLLRELSITKDKNGKPVGEAALEEEREFAFDAIKLNLTDDSYEKAIEMPLQPGMQVIDQVANITYFVGADGKPEAEHRNLSTLLSEAHTDLAKPISSGQPSIAASNTTDGVNHHMRNYLLGSIVIIAAVSGLAYFMFRRKGRQVAK